MVQRVEIDVRVSVEMVVVTFSISELPEVTVFVTGHVVRVVYTLLPGQSMSTRKSDKSHLHIGQDDFLSALWCRRQARGVWESHRGRRWKIP